MTEPQPVLPIHIALAAQTMGQLKDDEKKTHGQ